VCHFDNEKIRLGKKDKDRVKRHGDVYK